MAGRAGREDILLGVTTKSPSVTSSPVRALRSSLRLSVPLAVTTAVLMATPAMADLPEAWETPEAVGFLDHAIYILGLPVAVALVITLLVLVPSLARGEKLSGHAAPVADEWFGGPRGGKAEVEAAGAAKDSGGASGTW